jgi:hypothetical protein
MYRLTPWIHPSVQAFLGQTDLLERIESPANLVFPDVFAANALACGFTTDRIEVSGPKGEALLRQLVDAGVVINADNLWEVGTIARLATEHGGPRPVVLLRLSGFEASAVSRFGTPLSHSESAIDLLCEHRDNIDFLGFSFHLDTSDVGSWPDRRLGGATDPDRPQVRQRYTGHAVPARPAGQPAAR